MSPWRESVVIGVAPDALQVARLARGFARRTLERHSLVVAADNASAGWKAPLAMLENVLASSSLKMRSCRVVLSNEFVRFLLVPWHDELASAGARARLAQAQFRAVYGAAADAWTVRVGSCEHGASALACATDTDLVSALQSSIGAAGLTLESVRPHAAVAYNRTRSALPRTGFWFAAIESSRLWMGYFERDGWAATAARRIAHGSAHAIVDAIEQELAAHTHSAVLPPVYFSGAGLAADTLESLRRAGYASAMLESEGPLALGIGAGSAH